MFGDIHRCIGRREFREGEPRSIRSSARQIKQKFGISLGTACRLLGDDLGTKSLRKVEKTMLSEKQQAEG